MFTITKNNELGVCVSHLADNVKKKKASKEVKQKQFV